MKRVVLLIAFMLLCGVVFPQDKGGRQSDGTDYTVTTAMEKLFSLGDMGRIGMSGHVTYKPVPKKIRKYGEPKPLKYNKLYYLDRFTDSVGIFSHSRGLYMGEYIQVKNKPTFLRNGFGVDRTLDEFSNSKEAVYEYYIGFYRKNKRHGEGFVVRSNGKIVKAVWKKGRICVGTKAEPTPEEVEKVNDFMRQLKNMI